MPKKSDKRTGSSLYIPPVCLPSIKPKKKTVTIRDVDDKDWKLLTETADLLGLSMSDMVSILADALRDRSDSLENIFKRIEMEKKRRKEDLKRFLFPTKVSDVTEVKDVNIRLNPEIISTFESGTTMLVSTILHGRCEQCGIPLNAIGDCMNPDCPKSRFKIVNE